MSASAIVSSTAHLSGFWCALQFLDPRRWLATVLALVGITVSIVTAVLPLWIVKSLFKSPPPSISPSPRPLNAPRAKRTPRKRPSSPPVRPSTAPATVKRRSIRIADSDPHTTRIPSPSPQFYSFGSILASSTASTLSSSSNSSPDPSPPSVSFQLPAQPDVTRSLPEPLPVSVPVPELALFPSSSLPLPPSSYNVGAVQSLSCLDLATFPPSSSNRLSLPCPKRPFLLSRLGFGKRRSTTDLKTCKELAAIAALSNSAENESGLSPEAWQGDAASSATRNNTVLIPAAQTQNLLPQCTPPRRRFSVFGRDCPILKDTEKIPRIPVSDLIPLATPSFQPDLSASNAIAGPSVPRSPSPPSLLSSLPPLVPTQTPPMRPTRTDPYKTYGVPVPGSERARAFLKAEKAMRAQQLKRTRADRRNGSRDDGSYSKGEEPAADIVVEQMQAAQPEGQVNELGVLSSRVKRRPRSWCPTRRGTDVTRVQEVQRPPTRKSVTLPAKPPSKLCETFGLCDAKGASTKDRGYVSDTGVPSLSSNLL